MNGVDIINFFCGSLSGLVQVIVMQPFEMVKIRLANQSLSKPTYSGIRDCVNQVYKQQGFLAFYRGTVPLLLGTGLQNAMLFGLNQAIKRFLFQLEHKLVFREKDVPLDIVAIAGAITGIPSAVVITPTDRIRIVLQASRKEEYTSAQTAQYIYRKSGIRGLYLGFGTTVAREIIALMAYFTAYEYLMRVNQLNKRGSLLQSFISGALAGCLSWLVNYPIDYVKTLLQSQSLNFKLYKGFWDCARIQYRNEGYRTFYKGMGVTLLRSLPVNGCGLLTLEYSMRLFNRRQE